MTGQRRRTKPGTGETWGQTGRSLGGVAHVSGGSITLEMST